MGAHAHAAHTARTRDVFLVPRFLDAGGATPAAYSTTVAEDAVSRGMAAARAALLAAALGGATALNNNVAFLPEMGFNSEPPPQRGDGVAAPHGT